MKFFDVKQFFFMYFNFKNGCNNEFKVYKGKSFGCSKKKVFHKIELKAAWPRNCHADSVGVKI